MSYRKPRITAWLGLLLAALLWTSGCNPAAEEAAEEAPKQPRTAVPLDESVPMAEEAPADGAAPEEQTAANDRSAPADREAADETDEGFSPGVPPESVLQVEPPPQAEPGETSSDAPAEADRGVDEGPESGEEGEAPSGEPTGQAPAPAETTVQLSALSDAFREVARSVKPSVVQVAAEVRPGSRSRRFGSQLSPDQRKQLAQQFGPLLELDPELQQFFRGRRFEQSRPNYEQYNVPLPVGNASGWIYDDQGHVVTNHHVVSKADHITLTFHDDTEAAAALIGSDPQTDVAVLKTDRKNLTPASLATERVEQGDIVLAVGSPFRYAFSLSQGIVSAKDRRMGILGPQGYENFIQTDAAINPGNSGGPLTNARGEVVGMNTAIASRSGAFAGIGFAIPVEMIREVADELIRKGKVERGYLGVMISDDRRLLTSFGAERGVLVEDVVDDAPAEAAGLRPGDVVTAIDGVPIDGTKALRRHVAATDPGQQLRLTLIRDGQRGTLDVVLGGQPTAEQPEQQTSARPERPESGSSVEAEPLGKLGFTRLQTITPEIARQYDLEPSSGVVVLGVRRFSAAATSGIRRGNIITRAQGRKVAGVDELRDAIEGQDLTQGVRMRLHVLGGPARFVLLSLEN